MRRDKSIFKFLILSVVLVIIAIALIISLITRNVKSAKENKFAGEISKLSEELEKTDTASTQIGKTVENAEKDSSEEELYDVPEISLEEQEVKQEEKQEEKQDNNKKVSTSNTKKKKKKNVKQENVNKEKKKKKKIKETKETKAETKEEEIIFKAPLKGEIIREYAKDSLVYSNTLQEWVTHNGIDIKADKTSVVKAASKGKVSSIKNDPRYGLTVIITHDGGYQTVYSNLLTSEFVVKGEQVEAGQSIGTVGNSASFETADDYHLHFELLKDSEYVNPEVYINFE